MHDNSLKFSLRRCTTLHFTKTFNYHSNLANKAIYWFAPGIYTSICCLYTISLEYLLQFEFLLFIHQTHWLISFAAKIFYCWAISARKSISRNKVFQKYQWNSKIWALFDQSCRLMGAVNNKRTGLITYNRDLVLQIPFNAWKEFSNWTSKIYSYLHNGNCL